MNQTTMARAFSITCGVGLLPVALGYGLLPSVTMDAFFSITIDGMGQTHLMRVAMCLYFGMATLWLAGAFMPALIGGLLKPERAMRVSPCRRLPTFTKR